MERCRQRIIRLAFLAVIMVVTGFLFPAASHAFIGLGGALDNPVDSDGGTPLVFVTSSTTGTAD